MKAILAVFVRANEVASAGGKTAVFGLLKRNGKVFVVVVKDTKSDTLMPIITSKIKPDSIVYTDSYKSYNALDVSDFKHFRINHSKEFAQDHNHIKAQENFWSQAKRVPPILQWH